MLDMTRPVGRERETRLGEKNRREREREQHEQGGEKGGAVKRGCASQIFQLFCSLIFLVVALSLLCVCASVQPNGKVR